MFTSSKELTPGVERAWPPIVDKIEYKLYFEKNSTRLSKGQCYKIFGPPVFCHSNSPEPLSKGLNYFQGPDMNTIDKKNRGRKSRDTVPSKDLSFG